MSNYYLGISAFYHDSAAAVLHNDEIIAAAHEERFSRIKHDQQFPENAIRYVLNETGLSLENFDAIAFYDKPFLKFERLLETYHAFAPKGLKSFLSAMPVWIKEKLFMKKLLWDHLHSIHGRPFTHKPVLLFPEHHLSHAASAFYPSPFNEAAILTIDGVGEWATTTIGLGRDTTIEMIRELHFPHSIGLLYSAFTYYCGFKVNSGEYKLMGLAPYGLRTSSEFDTCKAAILSELVDIREDGSLLLNMDYFDFATGHRMCLDDKWDKLFGISKRQPESELTQPYMDMALAIQDVTEAVVVRLARTAKNLTGSENLVMAGGVALNCVANAKIKANGIFNRIWIQPASGDAGGALGAALACRYIWKNETRKKTDDVTDSMKGSYLGPSYSDADVLRLYHQFQANWKQYPDFENLCQDTARLLADGKVIGWFQGRMEWGPRALGNRSILADPRSPDMQKRLNLKIKFREGFRPFAPSVLAEDAAEYFEMDGDSPYMLLVAPVVLKHRNAAILTHEENLFDRLYQLRSDIPAITHIDFSARIQTVHRETNERYWKLIQAFKQITGYGLVVNTSFNVRGEPIVCTPKDAYQCFMRTEMDWLVINNCLFEKSCQPKWAESGNWREEFRPD
ncbi:MAG: carbamoyltransferase [Desulfatirhabdiaceae bacterium]